MQRLPWTRPPRYRREAAPITRVYRIALNAAISALRKRWRRPAHLSLEAAADAPIHTSEFDSERKRSNVEAYVREQGLDWPHLLDNDYRYWNALDNHYWPAVSLVDRCGRIRGRFVGEIHSGQPTAVRAEAEIALLLAEPGDCRER